MELQLLPTPHSRTSRSCAPSRQPNDIRYHSDIEGPSLDLQLSNGFQPSNDSMLGRDVCRGGSKKSLKWQESDQNQIGSIERQYVEHVREMTQREMQLAQSELSCARHMWERAQEEVEKVENMRAKATRWIDSTCMEITCQSCNKVFRR